MWLSRHNRHQYDKMDFSLKHRKLCIKQWHARSNHKKRSFMKNRKTLIALMDCKRRRTPVRLRRLKPKQNPQQLIQTLLKSFKKIDATAQLQLWRELISSHPFDYNQMISLHTAIDERFRLDILSNVPYEIALYILSFLSPEDLGRAAQVCRSWRILCEDNQLWREKCQDEGLHEGLKEGMQPLETVVRERISNKHTKQEKQALETLASVPRSEWKLAYLKHMQIVRNWKTRSFDVSKATNYSKLFLCSNINNGDQAWSRCRHTVMTKRQPRRGPGAPHPISDSRRRGFIDSFNNDEHPSGSARSLNPGGGRVPPTDPRYGRQKLLNLRCHEEFVITCLQYNPKTNTIVSGSDDMTLKVWCSETGQCINTLEGHTGGVWTSQLSPDDIVISGSTDRTLRVWEAHSGKLLHILYGHSSTVRCLALNGDQVVSGSRDSTLRLWNIIKGTCEHVFSGHTAAVRCVEYANDIIVSGAYDCLVMVWNAKTSECLHALEGHTDKIYSLQFDGSTIASGSLDMMIYVWDAATGKLRHELSGHQSLTSKMQLKNDILVSANADTYCKVWDISTGQCLHTLGSNNAENKHASAITSVYFNNRFVVTSSDDGTVKLWDIKTGEFIRNLVTLPTSDKGGVVWRIRGSYSKLICAAGSRTQSEDTHLLVLNFNE